jgi:hypothetical protein
VPFSAGGSPCWRSLRSVNVGASARVHDTLEKNYERSPEVEIDELESRMVSGAFAPRELWTVPRVMSDY